MDPRYQAEYIGPVDALPYVPGSAVTGGAVVDVSNGALALIAHHDMAANYPAGVLHSFGRYRVRKVAGIINQWAYLYWDADANPYNGTAGSGAATTSSSGNTPLGWAYLGAASTDEDVEVLVLPAVTITNTIHNPTSNLIADPGASGAIPVTDSGYCPLVSTGAQTRTLAAPTYAGQQLLLCMKTDGGDVTLTCATGLNQTGNNTAVFNDAGDTLLLVAVYNGSNLRWRVVANDTVALSTV